MPNLLFIIPPERFRDEELFLTKEVLEKDGHKITIASTKSGVITGSRGQTITSEITLERVKSENYSAVVLIGGGGSKLLWVNSEVHRIVNTFNKSKKVVAAICLAPVTLALAGVLKNRNATVAGTESSTIEALGARYTGPGVTVDGNIVTGNAPKASVLFAQKISELLKMA